MTSQPVTFANRDGLSLVGILHMPDGPPRAVAVVLLSPGVKMRVAPHRLYLKLARRLVALGFPVLRFDFAGLGDSEGEIHEEVLARVYNSIQAGRYVNDTLDAMQWLEREHGVRRFVLGGLCGGALTGLLAAERDGRAEALLAIGIPTSFEGLDADYDQYLTRGQLRALTPGYIRKLLDPHSLFRFLTLRSSYGVIWRAFRERFFPSLRAKRGHEAFMGNVNPKFAPAFLSMMKRSHPILLIFGGGDRWLWEFEEKFEVPKAGLLAAHRGRYEKHVVPGANHILSSEEWLSAAWQHVEAWLLRHYPAETAGHRITAAAGPRE